MKGGCLTPSLFPSHSHPPFEVAGERGCPSTRYIVCLTDITLADNVTWTVDRMECRCVGMESRQSP